MLTDTFIKSLRPAPLLKKHFDGNGRGLHLICHPGGKRTFAIKYLHPVTRKEQTLNVGEYPTTTLKDARDQAINTRVVLAQGLDPRELRAEPAISAVPSSSTYDHVTDQIDQVAAKLVQKPIRPNHSRCRKQPFNTTDSAHLNLILASMLGSVHGHIRALHQSLYGVGMLWIHHYTDAA